MLAPPGSTKHVNIATHVRMPVQPADALVHSERWQQD